MKKHILITGGTGSFGKKYTKILLEKYKVISNNISVNNFIYR